MSNAVSNIMREIQKLQATVTALRDAQRQPQRGHQVPDMHGGAHVPPELDPLAPGFDLDACYLANVDKALEIGRRDGISDRDQSSAANMRRKLRFQQYLLQGW